MFRSDTELVEATRAGSPEAYGQLVSRYQGHVYGLAYSLVGNWADAQDVAQETFIRAYVNLEQLREAARFPAWLRRVTFGVTIGWLRTYQPARFAQLDGRVDLDSLEIPDFAPGPPEVVEKQELAAAVLRAVASLPPKYRVPLTMFHLDGLSYEKVANFLDIPLGTAKSLISRARQKLKEALLPYYQEELVPMVQEVFNEHKLAEGAAWKLVDQEALTLVGIASLGGSIETLWQRFEQNEQHIQHKIEGRHYELHVYPKNPESGPPLYFAGVAVTKVEDVPEELVVKPLPPAHYAVFVHHCGVESYDVLNRRINEWLETGPYQLTHEMSLQIYDPTRFKGMNDPASEIDLLIPIEPKQ